MPRLAISPLRAQAQSPLVLSLAASACMQGLGILTGVILARVLGPEGRGELAAVVLWPTLLVAVGSLGITDAVAFHTARRTTGLRTLMATSLGLVLVQGLLLLAIGLVLVPVVLSQYDSSTVRAGLLFLLNVPFALLALYLFSLLNGMQRFGWFNFLRVLVIAAGAAGIMLLAVAHELTVTTAAISYLAGTLLTAVASMVVSVRETPGSWEFSAPLARDMFHFGWRSQLSTASNLLNERLDQLVISVFLAPLKLGLYVVAWTLTSFTGLIGAAVSLVALPAVARCTSQAERVAAARRYVSLAFAGSLAAVIPLIALTPAIVRLAFGESFEDSIDIARVLLLASVALATGRVLNAVLKGLNRPLDAGIAEERGSW